MPLAQTAGTDNLPRAGNAMHPVSQVTMAACSPPCALVKSHPSQGLNYQCHLRSPVHIVHVLPERKLSPTGNAT